ncbi:MAG: hypothetical protein Q8P64_10515, partial [Deltaproteobacteria bacterium]|nr:hypothetical protein [Deltaproteobacteria bacterium]
QAVYVRVKGLKPVRSRVIKPELASTLWKIGTHTIFGGELGPGRGKIESRPISGLRLVEPKASERNLQPVFKGCRVRGGAVSEDLFRRG